MFAILRNRIYRNLFAAQVIALIGTGLATVALGLLAYDLAGADAGSVLGTALAIKMVAYVTIAPVIGALADKLPRRTLMVTADLTRAGVALFLPFVDQVWQVYVLVFLLQSASAAFTPTFQAVIPDVLPEEREYTQALSMSRLAYDLESLFSPALAAALLSVITYNWLFTGTMVGFVASGVLVLSVALPKRLPAPAERSASGRGSAYAKATAGARLFFTVPRLRALLALNLAVAAASAMVVVNTVIYVREFLGLSAGAVPLALGAYGAGSMIVALILPRVLDRMPDRTVMLRGALLLGLVFAALTVVTSATGGGWRWPALLAVWAAFGAANSMVLTPSGRLIRRSAPADQRASVFAAQFSLSHVAWLVTYPLAGWLGAGAGLRTAAITLGAIALGASLGAVRLWRTGETTERAESAPGTSGTPGTPVEQVGEVAPVGQAAPVGQVGQVGQVGSVGSVGSVRATVARATAGRAGARRTGSSTRTTTTGRASAPAATTGRAAAPATATGRASTRAATTRRTSTRTATTRTTSARSTRSTRSVRGAQGTQAPQAPHGSHGPRGAEDRARSEAAPGIGGPRPTAPGATAESPRHSHPHPAPRLHPAHC
ncbi:MFS transporter [Streptomyces sp. NPDC093252]|uniref:MFS transporter n=1 Tax=Streptomyces sp. NPDC093252 TaxID=3154980 RepID=UPI00343856F6